MESRKKESLLELLPQPLMAHIFSFLDDGSLWRARLVSRSCAHIGFSHIRRFCVKQLSDLESVTRSTLRVEEISFSADKPWRLIADQLARLHTLTSLRFSVAGRIEVRVPDLSDLPFASQLQRLVLRGFHPLDTKVVARLRGLRELHVESTWDNIVLQNVAPLSQLSRLTRLQLCGVVLLGSRLGGLTRLAHLEELRLCGIEVMDPDPLSRLTSLRRLLLHRFHVHVDSEVEEPSLEFLSCLTRLVHLELSNLDRVFDCLPDLDELSALRSFRLATRSPYVEPEELGEMPVGLTSLSIASRFAIEMTDELPILPALRRLDLETHRAKPSFIQQFFATERECYVAEELSPVFAQKFFALEFLRLNFNGLPPSNVSDAIAQLRQLQEVELLNVVAPRLNLSRLTGLRRLTVINSDLSRLDGLGSLHRLESLRLRSCFVQALPVLSLAAMSSMRELTLKNCKRLTSLPPIGSGLRKLVVSGCVRLSVLPSLEAATALTKLTIQRCTSLLSLPALSPYICGGLLRLTLGQLAFDWRQWPGSELPLLESLTALRSLKLVDLAGLPAISCLEHRGSLQKLHVIRVSGLQGLQGLEALTGLTSLEVELSSAGQRGAILVPELATLTSLRHFGFNNAVANVRPGELSQLSALRTLRLAVDDWKHWRGVTSIAALVDLTRVTWDSCGDKKQRNRLLDELDVAFKFSGLKSWRPLDSDVDSLEADDVTPGFVEFVELPTLSDS